MGEEIDVNPQEPEKPCKITHVDVNDIPPRTAPLKVLVFWCVENILLLKSRQPVVKIIEESDKEPEEKHEHKHKEKKPWYKSAGIWFAIILVGIVIYAVFLFYMQQKGYNIRLPNFMLR